MRAESTGTRGYGGIAHTVGRLLLASVVAFLLLATSACAVSVTDRPLLFSFNGADTTVGRFEHPSSIAVDDATGGVYVYARSGKHGVIDKFNVDGEAQDFIAGEAAGTSSLNGTPSGLFNEPGFEDDLAVDNSGGLGGPDEGEQGRLYVDNSGQAVSAFNSQGEYMWTLPKTTVTPCGIDVDGEGHLWAVDNFGKTDKGAGKALEFANNGSPPAQIGEKEVALTENVIPCRLASDQTGEELYASGNLNRAASQVFTQGYGNGLWVMTLTTKAARDLADDHSKPAGNIFVLHPNRTCVAPAPPSISCSIFTEFDTAGTKVGDFGDDLVNDGNGIAYSSSDDRVYVSQADAKDVRVFGPKATGTAPDVSSAKTDELEQTEATAHGTSDPQGTTNSYHFEWALGGNESKHLFVDGVAGTFRLWVGEELESGQECCREFTAALPFDISPQALQEALETLGPIGSGNVTVSGTPANPENNTFGEYNIAFSGQLAASQVPLVGESIDLGVKVGSPQATVSTTARGPDWASAQSSPLPYPSITPADTKVHPVSFRIPGLKANTTYSVRLVGTNTANHLSSYSLADVFKTASGPKPEVKGCVVSTVGPDSAHFSCEINSRSSEAGSWRVQKSTDPNCIAGFNDEANHVLPGGEAFTVVGADLEGLLPAQHYCARIVASNGFSATTTSEIIQFSTLAIKADEASTAFAAPRTDTSARLNGRVNPEGAAVTYHFEWSRDGSNWTSLPDHVSNIDAREEVVVGEELGGLQPATTYHYRLAAPENEAGTATVDGEERTFITRSVTEVEPSAPCPNEDARSAQGTTYLHDCRGIELVNSPDKGNQTPFVGSFEPIVAEALPFSADGGKFVWQVTGGAPEGTSGTFNAFLARREPEGWRSRDLIPPAAQQIGGGDAKYLPVTHSKGFSRFLFRTDTGGALSRGSDTTFVRLDDAQHQETLVHPAVISSGLEGSYVDATDDLAHIIYDNTGTEQLADIGVEPHVPVGLMANGLPPECGIEPGVGFNGAGGGAAGGLQRYPGYHWINTEDASTVYFETAPNGSCNAPLSLFMRDVKAGTTTEVAHATSADIQFIRATSKGQGAFFVSKDALTGEDENSDNDVYRWSEGKGLVCLTCVVPDAALVGQVLVSDDFSHIYFQSADRLVSGRGKQGVLSLYALSNAGLHFVGPTPGNASAGGTLADHSVAQISSDGNVLAFLSSAPTGQLTADGLAVSCGGAQCRELYRYDDRDGSLECVSCLSEGTTTENAATENVGETFGLSGDGETLAFSTRQALLETDVNHSYDIYEWRRGVLGLITDGVTKYPGFLGSPVVAGVDSDGSNVFFKVADPQLTGFEQDLVGNLYDARIDGGFVLSAPLASCSGESCQGPLQPAPGPLQPSSSKFHGRGNLVQSGSKKGRCARAKTHRRAHCTQRNSKRQYKKGHRKAASANKGRAR